MNYSKRKKQNLLKCLLDKGRLEEVETIRRVDERNGKKYTRIEMTFKVSVKGKITHDDYDTD